MLEVKRSLQIVMAFLAALLVTAAFGSVVQTQVNLAALADLGAPLTVGIRVTTTFLDLVTFGPVMAAIAGAALLPGLAIGHAATLIFQSRWRAPILAAAGAAGVWAAFSVMGFFTPMPTLVAAARGQFGLAIMSMTGIAGGLVYARLTRPGDRL